MERRLFALDHNFPEPLLATFAEILPADLVPIRKIDPSLSDLADWALLLALWKHERPWDGLITNDEAMFAGQGDGCARADEAHARHCEGRRS